MKIWGKIKIEDLKELEIMRLLESHNFDKIHNKDYLPSLLSSSSTLSLEEEYELNNDIGGYDYLMDMPQRTFKEEEVIS